VVNFTSWLFTLRVRTSSTHWIRDWMGIRACLDVLEKKKISCPCQEWDSREPSPQLSLHPDCAVPAPHNTHLAKVLWTNTLFNTIPFTDLLRPWLVRHSSGLVSKVITQWQCQLTHLHKPISISEK
jgi:hypothetical protein